MSQPSNDKDVICPECCRVVTGAAIMPVKDDRYRRKTRSYFGHCMNCQSSFEVIQYYHAGKELWAMHMVRYYVKSGGGKNVGMPWEIIEALPKPEAAVVVGPGGEYDQEVHIEPGDFMERAARILEVAEKSLGQAASAIGNLAKAARASKSLDHEGREADEG